MHPVCTKQANGGRSKRGNGPLLAWRRRAPAHARLASRALTPRDGWPVPAQNFPGFLRGLAWFLAVSVPAALVNSGLRLFQKQIQLAFMLRLSRRLHRLYCSNRSYYSASVLGGAPTDLRAEGDWPLDMCCGPLCRQVLARSPAAGCLPSGRRSLPCRGPSGKLGGGRERAASLVQTEQSCSRPLWDPYAHPALTLRLPCALPCARCRADERGPAHHRGRREVLLRGR